MESEMQELQALLQYLVQHNADHAGEIMDLAARAQALGKAGSTRPPGHRRRTVE